MSEKYIRVEDAILAAQEGADVWDGGCNPERDKHIRLAISAKPTYTPAEIMAQQWVPVTPETLPKQHGWYFTYGSVISVEPTILHYGPGGIWSCGQYYDLHPTHWLPKPQPPKSNVKIGFYG